MRAAGVDERKVRYEREPEFLVFIYKGHPGVEPIDYSWSVDSYLFCDTDFAGVLGWLRENLPVDCCWSLGVVQRAPRVPVMADSEFAVAWIVGGDVLNVPVSARSTEVARIARGMMERRHSVEF